jgi:hypothetical protein
MLHCTPFFRTFILYEGGGGQFFCWYIKHLHSLCPEILRTGPTLDNYKKCTSGESGHNQDVPPACLLVFAELTSSTLKMEAICSSETWDETRQTTRRHIPEDDTIQFKFCKQ